MTLTSMGRVAVPTPGTPVALSAIATKRVARIVLQTSPTNTGKTYFGQTGLLKSTLVGVSRVFAISDVYEIATADGTDGLYLSQLAIDADNANDALVISY